ncbi:hypothetical protein BDK51DRAFT_48752 [Blyttiomyces helicus]|uniref:Uncharacterized protein n=1 Tax=Blyttiomyces helicus TaxID=388810 RepID=A0A4P9VYA3_9FUNG|nr:hypothetical protein BDK51DRAFT_48752 [Blyttiomyces helicus]|eukprot:RKO84724.1 hypothetical protein BDK51DRAFT_48752 [Blyttiomyces helicus]
MQSPSKMQGNARKRRGEKGPRISPSPRVLVRQKSVETSPRPSANTGMKRKTAPAAPFPLAQDLRADVELVGIEAGKNFEAEFPLRWSMDEFQIELREDKQSLRIGLRSGCRWTADEGMWSCGGTGRQGASRVRVANAATAATCIASTEHSSLLVTPSSGAR